MSDDEPTLAQRVGNLAADQSVDLTGHERSKLEDAAYIIAEVKAEDRD